MSDDIAARFAADTATHGMVVLHDDGLYRHLAFRRQTWRPPLTEPQRSSLYWFDLITAPGMLLFQGDGDSFQFRRITDMFEFFRSPVGHINAGYWSQKVTSGQNALRVYDPDLMEARVMEDAVQAVRDGEAPETLVAALRRYLLSADVDLNDEAEVRRALEVFDHGGWEFADVWEMNFTAFYWWFEWALHAIVWGIAQYDAHHGRPPLAPRPRQIPKAIRAGQLGGLLQAEPSPVSRRVETVQVGSML